MRRRRRGGQRRHEWRIGRNRRKLPDGRRDIRSWRQLRDERLDLAPAPTAGLREDGLVVLRREVLAQQPDGRKGYRARGEEVDDQRKASAGSGRLDPVAGGVFGKPKDLRAVTEERPLALGSVEGWSDVEFSKVRDQLSRCLALPGGEHADARKKIVIREARRETESVDTHIA